jgi:membrane fusion protein, multidrug efflux system
MKRANGGGLRGGVHQVVETVDEPADSVLATHQLVGGRIGVHPSNLFRQILRLAEKTSIRGEHTAREARIPSRIRRLRVFLQPIAPHTAKLCNFSMHKDIRDRRPLRRSALLLFVALGAAACGSGDGEASAAQRGGGPGGRGGPGGQRGGGPGNQNGPTPVEVAIVATGSLARTTMVSGALEPIRTVGVNAQLGGALTAVHVEEGNLVREGQVLAEVDAREIAAQVRSADAALAFAKSTAERSALLFKDRVMTAAEHERDQAALAAAQASLDQLRTRLGFARVRSPISGVITDKRVEAGDVVQGQARLFTVADVSTLVARVLVSELDVSGIREGSMAEVSVDALGGARFQARVRRIFPAADSTTRMVPVEVALTGSAARQLKPGFLARVTFRLGERENLLLAPPSAIVGSGQSRAVFVVKGEKVERRQVRIGSQTGSSVEILDGLAAGDSIVTVGTDGLRDGATIRIVRPVGAPEQINANANGGPRR